jgi:hypothetical protein
VRVVDDAVKDGVSDCGLPNHVVPARDGKLRGDDGGASLIALLEELEEIEALLIGQSMGGLARVLWRAFSSLHGPFARMRWGSGSRAMSAA